MNDFYDFTIYDIPKSKAGKILIQDKIENPRITILLNNGEYSDEDINFLSKIMHSIAFNIKVDCQIRTFDKNDIINLSEIHNLDKSKFILSFGLTGKQFTLHADIKSKQWLNFNTFSFILSNSLSELNKNVNLKREFWFELKKQFNA